MPWSIKTTKWQQGTKGRLLQGASANFSLPSTVSRSNWTQGWEWRIHELLGPQVQNVQRMKTHPKLTPGCSKGHNSNFQQLHSEICHLHQIRLTCALIKEYNRMWFMVLFKWLVFYVPGLEYKSFSLYTFIWADSYLWVPTHSHANWGQETQDHGGHWVKMHSLGYVLISPWIWAFSMV